MRQLRTLAVAATSAVLVIGQAVAAFACEQHQTAAMTAPARSATAKYHSLTVAKQAGYSILADTAGITCIAEPQMGAMGVHYVKGDLVKDPAIDATHPEALVYAPNRHGQLHLAALEYVVIKADWDANQPQPPSLGVGNRLLRLRRCSSDMSSTSPTHPTGTACHRSIHCTPGSGRTTLPAPSRCGIPACTVMRLRRAPQGSCATQTRRTCQP
jgi:hypothetical protein